jgi:hypothetical protein
MVIIIGKEVSVAVKTKSTRIPQTPRVGTKVSPIRPYPKNGTDAVIRHRRPLLLLLLLLLLKSGFIRLLSKYTIPRSGIPNSSALLVINARTTWQFDTRYATRIHRLCRRFVEHRPVAPVVGASEVTVVPEGISHRDIQVPFGTPGTGVKTLVDVSVRDAPKQAFGLQSC